MANKIVFSKAEILKIGKPEKRTYYQDVKTRGLILDVRETGSMTFQLYRKVKGIPKRIVLGRFDEDFPDSRDFAQGTDPLTLLGNHPALNVRMARMMATAINLELDKGNEPAEAKKIAKKRADGELTLRMAFDKYHDEYLVPHDKKTVTDQVENFARYLGEVKPGQKKPRGKEKTKPQCAVNWEKRKLSSIKTEDIRRMMTSLKEGIGAKTANNTLVMLSAVYNKAIEWGDHFGSNPCNGVEKFHVSSRDRFIQADELPRFFENLDSYPHQDFKDLIYLLLFTAMRKANMLELRWADIDFERRIIKVVDSQSKNNDHMIVVLTDTALQVLESRKNNKSEWVFPARSESGHLENPNKHWKTLLEQSRIANFHLHDLRRSLGSWAAITGASLPIIGKALGHKSHEATQVYARLSQEPVVAAMGKAEDEILKRAGVTKLRTR